MKANRAPASPGKLASPTNQSPGGDSNSHASGARASEARASTSSATRRVVQWSVRESNPPLQLEGLMSCADRRTDLDRKSPVGGEGVEPSACRLTILMATALQAAVRNTTRENPLRVARVGVEPTESPGLSRVALPVCVPCHPSPSAPPAGFEPATSTVTEWRALQAAPRRRNRWLRRESNPQHLSF